MHAILTLLWKTFNLIPEGPLKIRLRFFMAFSPLLPRFIKDMSPILASTAKYMPRPGDVVVDAGAFPGDVTIFSSRKVGDAGKVIAFEPNPVNFKHLKNNVEAFGCKNVILLHKGLWNDDRTLKMSGKGVSSHLNSKGDVEVPLVSLDNELARLGIKSIDLITMDIEGAEVEALKGARKVLTENKVNLAIGSYHEFEGQKTQGGVEEVLKEYGYTFENDNPGRPNTYAWKN